MSIIDSTIQYLVCPDDGGSLIVLSGRLLCQSCKSEFRILNENTIELIPVKSFEPSSYQTNKLYSEYYSDLKEIGYSRDPKKRLWGLTSKSLPAGFVIKLRNIITKMIEDRIVCDVGAGVGDYSLIFAQKSKIVFHCDLDLEAINAAREKAKKQHLDNILFIRCNYFSLPFSQNSIPCITCIDVLLRGEEHDNKLMEQIFDKLQREGLIIVDFHSKERFKVNKRLDLDSCYSKSEIISLFSRFNLDISIILGTGYAPTIKNIPTFCYKIVNFVCSLFIPPARWIVAARKI